MSKTLEQELKAIRELAAEAIRQYPTDLALRNVYFISTLVGYFETPSPATSAALSCLLGRDVQPAPEPAATAAETASATPPAIGTMWEEQGGFYAGIMRGRDGGPDYHLIVGPEIAACTWKQATKKAAETVVGGFKDFTLPYRAEQALQFANVPGLFEKDWYWSGEQHASDSGCAWYQDFVSGLQDYNDTDDELRARAVRRLPIQ